MNNLSEKIRQAIEADLPSAVANELKEFIAKAQDAELIEAAQNAEPVVWDACRSYYDQDMFPSLDAALEKHHKPLDEAIANALKARSEDG